MKKNYVWTIRANRLVLQFATEALCLAWKRPEGFPKQHYIFLAPRSSKWDFISE